MNREDLRSYVALVIALGAPILTGIVLFRHLPDGAHEAAIILVTLAWQHVGTISRSLFPAPESTPLGKDV